MKSITMLLLIVAVVGISSIVMAALPRGPAATMDYSYDDYLLEFPEKAERYSLQVDSNEYYRRKAIFDKELEEVVQHNEGNHPWRKSLNQFSDMDLEEFLITATGDIMQPGDEEVIRQWGKEQEVKLALGLKEDEILADMTNLPPFIDWASRSRSHIPRNQGRCGSCYSFNSAAILSYYASAQSGNHVTLSTQQAVSCYKDDRHCGGMGGCRGSIASLIMGDYAKNVGIVLDEDYPYVSGEAGIVPECEFTPEKMHVAVKTTGATRLKVNDPNELLRVLAFQGPASVSISGSGIKNYYDGVLTNCTGPFNEEYNKYEVILSHAMIAVGYGTNDDGLNYWKLQNSWGNWARDGFAYIYRAAAGESEETYINTKPSSGYTCADEDQSPFPVVGTCGVLANTWIPTGVQYFPKPRK